MDNGSGTTRGVTVGVRMNLDLHARLEAAARADHFTGLSEWIRVRLAEAAERALAVTP